MKRLVSIYLRPVAVVMVLAVLFSQLDVPVLQAQQGTPVTNSQWQAVRNPQYMGTDPQSAFHLNGWKTVEDLRYQMCGEDSSYLATLKQAQVKEVNLGKQRLLTDDQAGELVNKFCEGQFTVVQLHDGDQYLWDMGKNGHYGRNLIFKDTKDFSFENHRAARVLMSDGFYIDIPDMCSNPMRPAVIPPPAQPAPQPVQATPPAQALPPAQAQPAPVQEMETQSAPAPIQPVYECADFFGSKDFDTRPFGQYGWFRQGHALSIPVPFGLQGWHFTQSSFIVREGDKLSDINDRKLQGNGPTYNINVTENGELAYTDNLDEPGVYAAYFSLTTPNGYELQCRVPVIVKGRHHCGKTCKVLIIAGAVAAVAVGTYFLWPRCAGQVFKTAGPPGPGR